MNHELKEVITTKVCAIYEKIKGYREHLHQNPELSYKEFNTMEYVAAKLKEIGIPYEKGVAGTGIIGIIRSSKHSENQACIGLRADLDALPIQEQNTASYKSKVDGVMHACGHDVHTSILLGAAEILFELREDLEHPVKLIFQPGEEKNPGGASLLIEAGVLENPKVKEMYALHVFPELEVGKFGMRSGLYMASSDELHLEIIGVGGHGAMPEKCINPILIGSEFIIEAQNIIHKSCPKEVPCVISFGHFDALGATNVIPDRAEIKGTFRTMNEEWREKAAILLMDLANNLENKYKGNVNLIISKGYPFLKNDEELTEKLKTKFESFFGPEKIEGLALRMTSEDFSFYSQTIPVCFFRLGVGNKEKGIIYSVHHPKFDIDSSCLKTG
ncbi:MAG: amidohydrolase, partial [Crocinitomicaceae bacterium]|nr:amidohydrolase [Crocinitomicaceae bacterium]